MGFYSFFAEVLQHMGFVYEEGGGHPVQTWVFSVAYFFLLFQSPSKDSPFSVPLRAVMLTASLLARKSCFISERTVSS